MCRLRGNKRYKSRSEMVEQSFMNIYGVIHTLARTEHATFNAVKKKRIVTVKLWHIVILDRVRERKE